jgi:hypothetical protein
MSVSESAMRVGSKQLRAAEISVSMLRRMEECLFFIGLFFLTRSVVSLSKGVRDAALQRIFAKEAKHFDL